MASQAVGHMPALMLFPLVPFLVELALVGWFVVVGALLFSAAEVTANPTGGYDMVWNENLRYMMAYHLFGLLWTNQFLVRHTPSASLHPRCWKPKPKMERWKKQLRIEGFWQGATENAP